ncbi:MAG: ATP-binding cassette domain-containing protein [Desulfobacterales bacterium]|nr:ATP-binding cassette domain-containing protein [Desulfobacterales bacterium]
MAFSLSDLKKVYGSRTVLDIPSLEIESGKIYTLTGPNGSGKTTLLNILALLEKPSSGRMFYKGRQIQFSESVLQDLRRSIVMVAQHPILFTTTVYKNIEFGLKIRKISRLKRKYTIEKALDLVGMRDFENAQAHRLSGGETQRVAFAQALAVAPDVLFCDEPTASIDVENQAAIINILRQANESEKTTIIFTTHDRAQAGALAHETLSLENGRLTGQSRENIFNASFSGIEGNMAKCTIRSGLDIMLPEELVVNREKVFRLLINPEEMDFGDGKSDTASGRSYKGTVKQISEENSSIYINVDIGIPLSLIMKREKYLQNPPFVGLSVNVVIPPEAVSII